MAQAVHLALIGGSTYDPLYRRMDAFSTETGIDVVVGFKDDHPALNRHLAACDGVTYDLVSTHSKYAPSQRSFLAPLDDVIHPEELQDFEPRTLDLARIEGQLFGLPRLVDVRLLHIRTDLVETPPATWDKLLEAARALKIEKGCYGFAFPGRASGLFGTFYELTEMGGSRLFPPGGAPVLQNGGGAWALRLLRTLYEEHLVPPGVPGWHFDEVHRAFRHRAFRDGDVAMIGDWPGFYGLHKNPTASQVVGRFAVGPYPAGPAGASLTYGGQHTFALTKQGLEKPEAVALLRFLAAPAQQLFEARNGSVPPRLSVMQRVQSEATREDLTRWQLLERVIGEQILIPPKLACYPQVEAVIWRTVQQHFTGKLGTQEALARISQRIAAILKKSAALPQADSAA